MEGLFHLVSETTMDLAALCTKELSEEGSWLKILDFDYLSPIGFEIRVLGPDSKDAIRIGDDDERAALRMLADAAGKKSNKDKQDELTSEDRKINKAVALTKDWKASDGGDVILNGKKLKFSPENAEILYRSSAHIRNQVLNFYQDRTNFTNPEFRNSAPQSGK